MKQEIWAWEISLREWDKDNYYWDMKASNVQQVGHASSSIPVKIMFF